MALDFAGLRFIDAIVRQVRKRAGKTRLELCSLGYQHITLSLQELETLAGKDAIAEALVRLDVYSTELLKNNRIVAVPLRDLLSIARMKKFDALKMDHHAKLLSDMESQVYVFEAEKLFHLMGCSHRALDIVRYNESDIIKDLNTPLEDNLKERFDLVLDSGTIEHCFNAPEAVKSVARMVREGGAALHISPLTYANHGFYNFTPCFFHEFYSANGFSTAKILGGFYRGRGDGKMFELPPIAAYPLPPVNCLIFYAAFKTGTVAEIVWPTQSVYRSRH